MRYDLRNSQGEFRLVKGEWEKALSLARMYGWEPLGTAAAVWAEAGLDGQEKREHEHVNPRWRDGSGRNDHRIVTAGDAANLAAALERALDDLPDQDCLEYAKSRLKDLCAAWGVPPPRPEFGELIVLDGPTADRASPREFFSGPGKQQIRDFIAFCRSGAFTIA